MHVQRHDMETKGTGRSLYESEADMEEKLNNRIRGWHGNKKET